MVMKQGQTEKVEDLYRVNPLSTTWTDVLLKLEAIRISYKPKNLLLTEILKQADI